MELSGSNTKKFLIFQGTEFSYISGNRNPEKLIISGSNFQAQKILKNAPGKIFHTLGKGSPQRISYIFSKKNQKLFLYFKERKPGKNSSHFRKRNFHIFQERPVQNPKIFRSRSIVRTLTYLELEACSKLLARIEKSSGQITVLQKST